MRKICILVPLLLLLPPVFGQDLIFDSFTHYTNIITWHDAQTFCRKYHSDLITIEDDFENQYFNAFGWIGLYRNGSTSPWTWSSTGEAATYTNWDVGEPKNDCAYKYNTGKWRTDVCSVRHTYTCVNKSLILVRENKTWEEALKYCRTLNYQNSTYDLATLLTPHDHVLAVQKAQGATTDEVWTGLRYLAGYWMWVGGGGSVQYTDIDSCPTQTHCGILLKNSTKLYDLMDCSQRKNFLCYKKL